MRKDSHLLKREAQKVFIGARAKILKTIGDRTPEHGILYGDSILFKIYTTSYSDLTRKRWQK